MMLRKCEDHSVWRTRFGRGNVTTDYVVVVVMMMMMMTTMTTSFSSKYCDLNYYHYTIV